MDIDWATLFGGVEYDPCAALQALRPAYMEMLTSGAVQKVVFRDREVSFSKADSAGWATLIQQLESECRAKSGLPARRFAITAGYRG